jgi:hypothetical protein
MSEKTKIFCNNCRQPTTHELVYFHTPEELEYLESDQQEDIRTTISKLWICGGCERVTLQEITLDEGGEEIGSEFYPSREKHYLIRKSFLQLNSKLSQIYEEIIICYNNASTILCATGLRALLEGVCADKGIAGKSLFEKINNLHTLLPGNIVESLHIFRFIGNEAVHQLNTPSIDQLRSAIEVMEDLLNFLYDLDYKASNISRKTGLDSGNSPKIKPSIEVIKRVLERNPKIAPRLITLFKILYQAGNKGLKYRNIASHNELSIAQLNGVLGALGRRINNTPGVDGKPGIWYFFDIVYEDDANPDTWGWCMRYELIQLIKNGNYPWAKDWK